MKAVFQLWLRLRIAVPGAGALVQDVSETRADMPSAAARRVLVASVHSRFFINLLFSIFIVVFPIHLIYYYFGVQVAVYSINVG